jgi:hypothetical protein
MTFNALFLRGSKDFLALTGALSAAELEQSLRHEQVAKVKGKKADPRRCVLRITSHRTRLLDTDNLCPKYFIDALRIAGVIEDDTAEHIDLQLSQEKVARRSEEKTVIEIEYEDSPEARDARGGRMSAQDGEVLSRHSSSRATTFKK